ncbi:hypothetical protein ABW21_db0201018 [Orbilia brochopaga]|nr:hypothetical protein ABW21_db0201018 [Drechslerella brochopaga]
MHCPRCLVRAYGAVLASHGYPSPATIGTLIAHRNITSGRRATGSIRRPAHVFASPPSTAVDKRGKFLTRGGIKSVDERKYTAALRERNNVDNSQYDDDGGGGRGGSSLVGIRDARALGLARTWDKRVDAAKVAEAVQKALNGSNSEHEEAVEMLKDMSSRGRSDLVVAWNHVIEWKLKRGNIHMALKLYNEMKRRGTKPDSYTYLRILNGLADNAATTPSALGRALTVYYSMTAPTSSVRPTIIHTNAALKVCAQAKDVDAIIDGSPDKSITEGRELWENILLKWQEGSLHMDEGLGCAMARLLLRSIKPEDWDDVLSLCQDVFGVPRLLPRMGSKARKLMPVRTPAGMEKPQSPEELAKTAKQTEEMTADLNDSISAAIKSVHAKKTEGEASTALLDEAVAEEENDTEESMSLVASSPDDSTALITEQIPSQKAVIKHNGLSVLLEACLSLRAYDTANNYWELITESYDVQPDRDNYHNRMRVLSMQSDSAGCLALAEQMAANGIELNQNLFFIALNGCRRAKKAAGFNDALRLLDLMKRQAVDVTSKVVVAFIRAASATEDTEAMKRAWATLGPGLFNIHKLIDPTGKSVDKIERDLECCQELVSLSDAILSRMYQTKLTLDEKNFADQVNASRQKIHKYINGCFSQQRAEGTRGGAYTDQIRSHKERKHIEGQGKKPLSVEPNRGRWTKFGSEEMQREVTSVARMKKFMGNSPGEVSLRGVQKRPAKSNQLAEALKVNERAPRSKRFMQNRDTDYTAHYRPEREKKWMAKGRKYADS